MTLVIKQIEKCQKNRNWNFLAFLAHGKWQIDSHRHVGRGKAGGGGVIPALTARPLQIFDPHVIWEEHSLPVTAHRFGLTLFSPGYSSPVYLWIVCTYSPPDTAHLEWFMQFSGKWILVDTFFQNSSGHFQKVNSSGHFRWVLVETWNFCAKHRLDLVRLG